VLTGDDLVDHDIIVALDMLRKVLQSGAPNDIAKYFCIEAFQTSLIWTINARSLRNFFTLRSSRRALREMRELAWRVFEQIPEDYRFLFEDCMEGVS
jgi:thymidylate synthase (FAD)